MPSNDFYVHGSYPSTGAAPASAPMRSELDLITAGFNKLPALTGFANKAVVVNAGATALTTTTGSLAMAGDLTITGAFNTVFVAGANVTLTLPTTSGTLMLTTGTAGTATNLSGGAAGQIPYQSAPNTTLFSAAGTAGQAILSGGATAPTFTTGTLALAGNFSTVGAFSVALTATAGTALTLPTTGTLATLAGAESLTNKTIGACTLSGTVSGGGNSINNVVIGAITPLAGAFTTLSASGIATFTSLTLTGALNEAKTTVASATTPDIWTGTGNVIDYTGTTTSTGLAAAPQAGARRTLICAGASLFTHGVNYILPGSANYTSAAGDRIEVVAITTTQFRLSISKADGTPVVGGGETGTWSSVIGSRAKDTVYQNTSGRKRRVCIGGYTIANTAGRAGADVGSANPPTLVVTQFGWDTNTTFPQMYFPLTFEVPNNWYYRLSTQAGTIEMNLWYELDE